MTHTPGPWYAVDNGHYIDINIADGLYSPSVASVLPSQFLESGDNSKANADLIAAAPDLLEALKAMLEMYGPRGGDIVWDGPDEYARAAIAKAEGRS